MSHLTTVYSPSGESFELPEGLAREALSKGFLTEPPAPPAKLKPRPTRHPRRLVGVNGT